MKVEEYLQSLRASGQFTPPYTPSAGGSELLFHCKQSECQGKDKPTLYVNNYNGKFYCHRCNNKGSIFSIIGTNNGTFNGNNEVDAENQTLNSHLEAAYVDALHATLLLPGFKEAVVYLTDRGLTKESIIRHKLGYSPSLHAISIPNLDHNGNALSLKYRFIDPIDNKYTQEALNGQSQLPYGLWLLNKTLDTIHIVEGEFDCIALKQIWPEINVIALPGKNAFPKNKKDDKTGILGYLNDYKKIYLYPDRELRATLDFIRHSEVLGRTRCVIINLPPGFKDINEMVSKGCTKGGFEKLIKEAENKAITEPYKLAFDLYDRSIVVLEGLKDQIHYSTGFSKLDTALNGIRPGELTIIAGEAGSGKTTIATQMLYHLMKQNVMSMMGSYEMPIEGAIIPRFLSLEFKKNVIKYHRDVNALNKPQMLKDLYFIAPDTVEITVKEVANHIDQLYLDKQFQTKALVALVIDNLSRFRPPVSLKHEEYLKWEEEQIITIKGLTRKYPNLHILLLAHLNKSQDSGMTKNRIRGSAVIAAEADNIVLLNIDFKRGYNMLYLDKVRSLGGRRGDVIELKYNFDTTYLEEVSEAESDDEY